MPQRVESVHTSFLLPLPGMTSAAPPAPGGAGNFYGLFQAAIKCFTPGFWMPDCWKTLGKAAGEAFNDGYFEASLRALQQTSAAIKINKAAKCLWCHYCLEGEALQALLRALCRGGKWLQSFSRRGNPWQEAGMELSPPAQPRRGLQALHAWLCPSLSPRGTGILNPKSLI